MYLKQPSKIPKTDKLTTTDFLDRVQKFSDDWFIKGLPQRPKDKASKKGHQEEDENEKCSRPFVYE